MSCRSGWGSGQRQRPARVSRRRRWYKSSARCIVHSARFSSLHEHFRTTIRRLQPSSRPGHLPTCRRPALSSPSSGSSPLEVSVESLATARRAAASATTSAAAAACRRRRLLPLHHPALSCFLPCAGGIVILGALGALTNDSEISPLFPAYRELLPLCPLVSPASCPWLPAVRGMVAPPIFPPLGSWAAVFSQCIVLQCDSLTPSSVDSHTAPPTTYHPTTSGTHPSLCAGLAWTGWSLEVAALLVTLYALAVGAWK